MGEDYVPDAQDEIIDDALAYGGHEFAAEVQCEAVAAAFASSGWDGQGDEPPEHYSAWLATAWQLVDQRRAGIAAGMIRPDLQP